MVVASERRQFTTLSDPLCQPASPADQPKKEQPNGENQQHVDDRANGEEADEPEQPRKQQNDRDGIQHVNAPATTGPRPWKNEGGKDPPSSNGLRVRDPKVCDPCPCRAQLCPIAASGAVPLWT
jgi:hypothetical protein